MPKDWVIQPPAHAGGSGRTQAGRSVPELVATVLANRGVVTDQQISEFLAPNLTSLHPPESLFGAGAAAELLIDFVHRKRKIVLYGDYDVDGTTGVAILWHMIRAIGGNVDFYVPHRIEEGYGLHAESALQLVRDGAECIVTVDCGITACESATAIATTGAVLIITDHHTPRGPHPCAAAIVHPALQQNSPNPDLCGAGVAFKLAWALAQRHCNSDRVSAELRSLLMQLLPLAALGTIADVVALMGENRIIAKHGLSLLAQSTIPGIAALIEVAGLRDRRIAGRDVGFKLAPRLNAAGRMGHANLAVELLTTADTRRSNEIAMYLDDHNRARQATERRVTKQAVAIVEEHKLAGDHRRAIVVHGTDWHPGVIGIVASRLVNRYHRPAIVIAMENGQGQGSGRSILPFDISRALHECADSLVTFGGHPMAAGLRVSVDNVQSFTDQFVAVANNRLTGRDLRPRLVLDAEVELEDVTLPTVELLQQIGPFGTGNPQPLFATDWLELAGEPRCVGAKQDHLQVTFRRNGTQIKAIGFGMSSLAEDLKQHRRCRVAFEPIISEFGGRRSVELQLLDVITPTNGH